MVVFFLFVFVCCLFGDCDCFWVVVFVIYWWWDGGDVGCWSVGWCRCDVGDEFGFGCDWYGC